VIKELNNREMDVKWAPRVFLVARLTWRFNDYFAYSYNCFIYGYTGQSLTPHARDLHLLQFIMPQGMRYTIFW
jgi:hypothetical protein